MKKHFVILFLSAIFMFSSVQASSIRTVDWSELKEHPDVLDLSSPQEKNAKMPIRTDLIGKDIRIPGYVVPLEADGKKIIEFLLVPYVGACTHVPPPPANQIILVKIPKGVPFNKIYGPVWVEGKLTSESTENEIAPVGYSLAASSVEVFE